jgi:hypothetical protein
MAGAPVVDSFSTEVDPAHPHSSHVLRWKVLNAEHVSIDGGVGDVTSASAVRTFVPERSAWKYLDDGSDQGVAWRAPDFDDSAWPLGSAKFGYGEHDESTVLNYGPDRQSKLATTYLRHQFHVASVESLTALTLRPRYDDGLIVYLDGEEIARYNMPDGTVTHDMFALGNAANDGKVFEPKSLPADLLTEGVHVLAVELHQSRPGSSDLSFDLILDGVEPAAAVVAPFEDTVYTLTASNASGSASATTSAFVGGDAVAYYPFDLAGSIPLDSTGKTAAAYFPEGGISFPAADGDALEFSGDRGLSITGSSVGMLGLRPGDGLSVGFWIKASAGLTAGTPVIDATAGGRGLQFSKADGDRMAVVVLSESGEEAIGIAGIFDGSWRHVVIVALAGNESAPGELRCYRDGALASSQRLTGGGLRTPATWTVAAAADRSAYFTGSLEQIMVFNGPMSNAVGQWYTKGAVSLLRPRIRSFRAADPTVLPGAAGRLQWQVLNAETLVLDSPDRSAANRFGAPVSVAVDQTFTLVATNAFGSAQASAHITVGAPPEILSFSGTPNPMPLGGTALLSWKTLGSDEARISPEVGLVDPAQGVQEVAPQSATRFTLEASNTFGSTETTFDLGTSTDPLPGAWTLATIPDTQHYSDNVNNAPIFTRMTEWLAANKDIRNIRFAAHVGDLVQNNSTVEWRRAEESLSRLEGIIPIGIATGNHDYRSNAQTRESLFNRPQYFGPGSPYAKQATLAGFFEHPADAPGRCDNTYHTITAGGRKYLIVCLEFAPRNQTVAWANSVVAAHPGHIAILVVHIYLTDSAGRMDAGGFGVSSGPDGANGGQQLWQKLIRRHPNFALVFCGHAGGGPGLMTSIGDAGNPVHQILFNPQDEVNGGDGFLRLLEFHSDGRTCRVKTYSPHREAVGTDAWRTDFRNLFDLTLAPILETQETDSDGDGMPDEWELQHGMNMADAGDAAIDSDHDGLVNLIEYLFDLDPRNRDSQGAVVPSTVKIGGQRYLSITYRRRRVIEDGLTVEIEVTGNLEQWQNGGAVEVDIVDNGDGTETVTAYDSVPMTIGRQRYLRIAARVE